ncbi:MAG: exonuclease SbcCD subunit D [Deltaproteobacteria bacterium]
MKKIRFIHLSDIHIGLLAHGKINPSTGLNTRLEDVLGCLDYVFHTARKESVDLVLIAGDVFHRGNPHPAEEIEFARRIRGVSGEGGARVLIVLGNHDYPSSGSSASAVEIFPALEIDGVTIVRKPELVRVNTKNGVVQVACLPWAGPAALVAREEYKSLSRQELQIEIEKRFIAIIRDLTKKVDSSDPALFLGHLAVRDARLSGTEIDTLATSDPVVPVGELAVRPFGYVGLGHIHRFQNLNPGHAPPVVYSGSIERIDFTEEKEKKGFVLGELSSSDGGWKCEFDFIETPARRFVTIEIGENDKDGAGAVNPGRFLPENTDDAIVRVRYEVSGPGDEIDEKSIKEIFKNAHSLKIERVFTKPGKVLRQAELSSSMNVLDALEKYIQTKPGLKKIGKDMKTYAEKLIRENE